MGRWVGGGKKGEQEVGVKPSPTACTLVCIVVVSVVLRACCFSLSHSHTHTQHKYVRREST